MLAIKDLNKTYSGGIQALKGITLQVPSGMFGLLGPNGAGKTTLMKIVATLLDPDSGTIEMNAVDFLTRKDKARQMLGYLPQEFGLYPTLTAEQMLDYLVPGFNSDTPSCRNKENNQLAAILIGSYSRNGEHLKSEKPCQDSVRRNFSERGTT